MTRVSSFSQNQSLLSGILRHQSDLFKSQTQVNTGKKSENYKGIASDASTLVSARTLKSKNDTYLKTGSELGQNLSAIDLQLSQLVDSAQSIRQSILSVLSLNNAQGFQQNITENFQIAASALNTKINGAYIFSGSQTETAPFTPQTLADLAALPVTQDGFKNDNIKASAQITDSVSLDYGIVADEVAKPFIDIIRNIHLYDTNPVTGPLNGAITSAQRTFLESQLGQLEAAIKTVSNYQAANGLRQQRVEEIGKQLEQRGVFLETFVSDIEDVNPAEAISRVQNDRTALEASYRVVSSLNELTLTKFI